MDQIKFGNSHFAKTIGIKIIECRPDKVVAVLDARDGLANRSNSLHGGVIMALADTLGGFGTTENLPPGYRTFTIESKTNFLRRIPLGDTARAECTPLHRGLTTMVWETKIFRGDGVLAAIILQTQLVVRPDVTNLTSDLA